MLDVKYIEQRFKEYTSNYDLNRHNIKNKYYHSFRVEKLAKQIAESLNLDDESIKLATVIGLLHDIGRFEQLDKYSTFNDFNSFDHGDYGAQILSNELKDYFSIDVHFNTIVNAVKYHNKFSVDSDLDEEILFYTKLVRDADKVDILYESTYLFWSTQEDIINNSIISDYTYDCIKHHSLIESKKGMETTKVDDVLKVLAYTFDVNFKPSFQIIKDNDYINRTLDRYSFSHPDTNFKIIEIRSILNNYIESNLSQ